jgi:TATA element modulatory factor
MTLQERLAASIARSRATTPKATGETEGRGSMEIVSGGSSDVPSSPVRTETSLLPREAKPDVETPAVEETVTIEDKDSVDAVLLDSPALGISDPEPEQVSQLRTDLQASESRRSEELLQYTSRMASLEEKLKLMSEITAKSTAEVLSSADSDAWERKLADREEKIVRLLDEGEKLAKIELNLTTIIKSLRAKQKEDTSTVIASLNRAERTEKQLGEIKLQLKKANDIERKNTERLKIMYKIEAANEALRREKETIQVRST